MVVDVLIEIKARQIVQTFTYLLPPELEKIVMIGSRILVPFNNRNLEGFVLKKYQLQEQPQYALKKVTQAVDEYPVLNKELLELGNYISKKTLCNLISAYQTMLPTALKAKSGTTISKKYESYIVLNKEIEVKSEKQQQIIDFVMKNTKVTKKECSDISLYALNTLLKQNILKEIKEETYRLKEADHRETQRIMLNEEQQIVVKKVLKNKNIFSPFLLHGVTGSGKTEVYMHIIEEILKDQKEAIVLVPEISLTPQIVTLFRNRFGNKIAILHSRLSNGEKYDEWRKIERKEVSIVIGARSAIFAPFTNLGMIVIDEEHTETYKQENTPKYSAIDIALWRAKYHHCPIVLGSATPSLESYTRAKSGIYKLLTLKTRISKHLPEVHLVDMKYEIRRGNRIFGEFLTQKIN